MKNNFVYVNHDNIKPRQHFSYGGFHLNTAGSKIVAENFILALSRQTWLGIIQDNDALIENVSETEPRSEIAKYFPEDSLESKSDNHENYENISFSFLKKIKSEHPKNLFFRQFNVNSIRNKSESVQEINQNTFDFFFVPVRLKLIPLSQINCFVFLNTVYFERIVMHVVEDYFSM